MLNTPINSQLPKVSFKNYSTPQKNELVFQRTDVVRYPDAVCTRATIEAVDTDNEAMDFTGASSAKRGSKKRGRSGRKREASPEKSGRQSRARGYCKKAGDHRSSQRLAAAEEIVRRTGSQTLSETRRKVQETIRVTTGKKGRKSES